MLGNKPAGAAAILLLATLAIFASETPASDWRGPVYEGDELDYQPSLIRIEPDDILAMVFERIEPASFYGDFFLCFSDDGGATWSHPVEILHSALNRRHPSLVRLADGSYSLFYLVDETGSGSYRLHRAVSPDCLAWTSRGRLDLGWLTSGEINPCVIVEDDASLTMTYQRLSGPVYIARSLDGGATWDDLKTKISPGNAQLPRLTKREMDGLYLVTYQVGSSNLDMFARTTTDPYDWSGPVYSFSTAVNSHDSQPMVLTGGTFFVPYAQQAGSVFDIYYRTSFDGAEWTDAVRVTTDTGHYDTQPHPLRSSIPGSPILAWSHQVGAVPYEDHDVWIDTGLDVPLPLGIDIDEVSFSTGDTVSFRLDAGASCGGSEYFLVGGISGTSPGTQLPGGGVIPLNRDAVTDYIIDNHADPMFLDFRGYLDGHGEASAELYLPPSPPLPAGTIVYFAFTTLSPFDFQSNPVSLLITP